MTAMQHVRPGAWYHVALPEADDFGTWRDQARRLVQAEVPPDRVTWSTPDGGDGSLFGAGPGAEKRLPSPRPEAPQVRASRAFLALAGKAVLHSDPERFALLYRLLWRLQTRPQLLDDAADADVLKLEGLARVVRRDIHKMRAFVRFRSVIEPDGSERFVAWFEPSHHILRANARFFVDRFASMRWSILTPRGSLHWDGEVLSEGPPAQRSDAPDGDPAEDLWRRYYASTFNPARLKIGAMLKEMPRKYWKNMPEAALIPALVAGAQAREAAMVSAGENRFEGSGRPDSLAEVAMQIGTCTRCAIGCNGTRAVAGEGPERPALMIVGEQPGDTEETEGRPFVGPAGQLLDRYLGPAGIDRGAAYVTNAVKHFKFEQSGKRRLHKTPTAGEIDICRWWLEAETALVKPRHVLALGASAARALLGRSPSIARERGKPIDLGQSRQGWITVHPSYLLRLSDGARELEAERFAADLALVADAMRQSP
ncbi:UdgX family uracil-DNA binding protein [Novosphingobium sp.]|uniref:UdgX family uracil-DNA binding protein n=1 Tax=Novosphingobium sp. TaxID=1874826 RepID=UPI0025DE7570|nr:UdgX family uracil-DNA binding protein [Novosphingobium sp.]